MSADLMSQSDGDGTRQYTARDMLAMIFRRKWVILSIFLLTLALGISASLKTTSEFVATAKILIRRAEASSFQSVGFLLLCQAMA